MGAGFGSFVDGLFGGYKSVQDLMNAREDLQMKMLSNQKLRDASDQYGAAAAASGQQQGQPGTAIQPTPATPEQMGQEGYTGAGGGSGGGGGGWGPLANQAIDYFRAQGYSDAAIQGILANGLAEGGFNNLWAPGDNGTSFGPWQYHQGGELGPYLNWATTNKVQDPHQLLPQMQYLDNWLTNNMPGFKTIQDPRAATDQFLSGFEKPAAQYNYPGARYSHLATVQHYMTNPLAAGAPPAGTPQTALATPGPQGQLPPGSEGTEPAPPPAPGALPPGSEGNPGPAAAAAPVATVAPSAPASAIPAAGSYAPPPGQVTDASWRPYGDSLAGGFIRFAGLPGSVGNDATDTVSPAANGRNSGQVLANLQTIPTGSLKGQNVILSSGFSNDSASGPPTQAQIDNVNQQIAQLKRAGAGRINLIGVGTQAGSEGGHSYNLNEKNAYLANIARQNNIEFGGGLPARVHPNTSYYTRHVKDLNLRPSANG